MKLRGSTSQSRRVLLPSGREPATFPAEVPRPENWGGYRLKPDTFEFWQGRPSRMHDRFEYVRAGEAWHIERLMP